MVGACIDSEPALDVAWRFHRPESEAAGQASLPCPATSGSRLPCIDPRIGARRANHFVFCQTACPAPFAKIFFFPPDPNHFTDSLCPVPQRGGSRVVTNAGRDAVDARAPGALAIAGRDEPRERSASVQDDRRLSGRQSRVVLAPVAGVKSVEASRPDRALYKPLIRG